jgi:hypothetical protein
MKKSFARAVILLFMGAGIIFLGPLSGQEVQQSQIEKAKIYQEEYPLILDSDLYCSIYMLEKPNFDIRIIAGEKTDEKLLQSDADILYIDKGKKDGLEVGQMFLALNVGGWMSSPAAGWHSGYLVTRRGKVRVLRLEDNRGIVTVEKACGPIMVGDFLTPFEERETVVGKDLGFDTVLEEGTGISGQIVYLDREYIIAGSGYWAIINIGSDDGLKMGQQLTVFKRVKKDVPRQAIGNVVVIDLQPKTATVKVLSCRDALEEGFEVQSK